MPTTIPNFIHKSHFTLTTLKTISRNMLLAGLGITIVSCSSGGSSGGGGGDNVGDSGGTDTTAPTVNVTFPTPVSLTEVDTIIVHGTASDAQSGVASVAVNGVDATSSDDFATWQAIVPLVLGNNDLTVAVTDLANNSNDNAAQLAVKRSVFMGVSIQDAVLDNANNRVLTVNPSLDAIIAVDLSSGAATVLSDATTPNEDNALISPRGITLDSANNRALVTDTLIDAIIAVDLTTGARTVVSNDATPDVTNSLNSPDGLVLNAAGDTAWVADFSADFSLSAIVEVNLSTGARTILSNDGTPDIANNLASPTKLILDSANNRLLVSDRGLPAIIAVDLTAGPGRGERTVISDNTDIGALPFITPRGLLLDSSNNQVLVADEGQGVVMAVDLATGFRSIVSDNTTPDAVNALMRPGFLMPVPGLKAQTLLFDIGSLAILDLDTDTGARTLLAHNGTPNIDNVFGVLRDVVIDNTNNRLYVLDTSTNIIYAVALETGQRSILTGGETGLTVNPLNSPNRLLLDSANNRLLVSDAGLTSIIAVDLTSGLRTVLSNNTTPDGNNPLTTPRGMALDSANNRLLLIDNGTSQLLAIDLTDGTRTVLSDNTSTADQLLNTPTDVVLDSANNRALVLEESPGIAGIHAVNLATGARTVLSSAALGIPNATNAFIPNGSSAPASLQLDAANNRLLLMASVAGDNTVLAVDLTDGARSVLSSNSLQANNAFENTAGAAFDSVNNRLFVANFVSAFGQRLRAVLVVNLNNGERVVMSK